MVGGERASGAGVRASWGGSRMGLLFGDSFDVLNELLEDICMMGQV
jgi:hypothetical protein